MLYGLTMAQVRRRAPSGSAMPAPMHRKKTSDSAFRYRNADSSSVSHADFHAPVL